MNFSTFMFLGKKNWMSLTPVSGFTGLLTCMEMSVSRKLLYSSFVNGRLAKSMAIMTHTMSVTPGAQGWSMKRRRRMSNDFNPLFHV